MGEKEKREKIQDIKKSNMMATVFLFCMHFLYSVIASLMRSSGKLLRYT